MKNLYEIVAANGKNCTPDPLPSRRLFLVSGGALLAAAALEAKKDRGRDRDGEGYAEFRREDLRVIQRHYYGRKGGNLPPGLATRGGDLPPGLAKQLRRNGQLPPGLEKRIEPFPYEVEHLMPPLRPGLSRGFLDGQAIIYDPRTRVILDLRVIVGR